MFLRNSLLLVFLAFSMQSVQAMNVCIDEQGKKTVQDQPCPKSVTAIANEPMMADSLSVANAQETVRRFTAAINDKNLDQMKSFLGASFSNEVHRAGQASISMSKSQYIAEMTKDLSVPGKITILRSCSLQSEHDKESMVFSCQVKEQQEAGGKEENVVNSDEYITVVINDGVIKIGSIKAYIGIPSVRK